MRGLIRRFLYTFVMLVLATLVTGAGVMWHINVFELPAASVIGIEQSEIGEIAIAFLLVIPAFFIDRVVARERAHEAQFQAEQLRVVRMTIRTVQDIVNNNLNQLQLLRMEADGVVPTETLELFDAAIQDTAAQLTALGNMDVFTETTMETGQGVAVPGAATTRDR